MNSSELTNEVVEPEVKVTGPGSASAGSDKVTLIGNLIGIDANQIVGEQFSQEAVTHYLLF